MAAHAFLKNEFTEDEKCHNLMRWLIICSFSRFQDLAVYSGFLFISDQHDKFDDVRVGS